MELKWSLFTKDIRPHPQLRVKLQQKVHKIEEHLESFPPEALHLKVSLEKHQKKKWFRVALALKLPSEVIRIQKFGDDPIPIFDQAVKSLLRELSRVKSTLRHEQDWAAASQTPPMPSALGLPRTLPGLPPSAAQAQ
jgi:ribosome-associated translation inhibitor RaiA